MVWFLSRGKKNLSASSSTREHKRSVLQPKSGLRSGSLATSCTLLEMAGTEAESES